MSTSTETAQRSASSSVRAKVQRFGTFLSGMIMPNIGAFIAWGLIAALFIEKGYFPNPVIGGFGSQVIDGKTVENVGLVGPMITYLLPLLIGYTGGKMVHDTRGGVVGAIATLGVIAGSSVPMFIGAMIMGPLAGWSMKKLDSLWDGKIKPGFEMLVNNFSAGIWGAALAVLGLFAVAPGVQAGTTLMGKGVQWLVSNDLLPLTSLLIEPAKILFLNNAINHGILTPLGTQQAQETGSSMLFLLEANPGPGMGVLLAFLFFGRGAAKASSLGASVIHFFGGIHEIYFPYVLMKPALLLAVIGGGVAGVTTLQVTGAGLRAPAAPGSILAVLAMTPPNDFVGVILSVVAATVVSFVIAALVLKFSKDKGDDLGAATARMEQMKGKKSSVASHLTGSGSSAGSSSPVKNIVFACDAGMGSSAMGASVLRNKIKDAGHGDVTVKNSAIANLKDEWDLVVVHEDLAERAAAKTPGARLVTVDNFMNSPRYEEIVASLGEGAAAANVAEKAPSSEATQAEDEGSSSVLDARGVILDGSAKDQGSAIDEAGALLVEAGAVSPEYVRAMHEREASVPTYMGNFLAIPHGTNEAKELISFSRLSFVRYPQGIDWNGQEVKFVIGIAGVGKEHLSLLSKIAKVFSDQQMVSRLEQAGSEQEILDILGKVNNA